MLNDAVCTTVLCENGRAAVAQMHYTWGYLTAQYPNFNSASFETTVNSIQSALDAIDSWYASWIPFNPVCCTIDEIGQQADIITNQMLASVGAANIPPPPASTDWGTVILIGGAVVLLVVYSPQVKSLLKK